MVGMPPTSASKIPAMRFFFRGAACTSTLPDSFFDCIASNACLAALTFGPPKCASARAASTSLNGMSTSRAKAPTRVVFTIGTVLEPSPFAKAISLASTVATRRPGNISTNFSGGCGVFSNTKPSGFMPDATEGAISVGSMTMM